jgi:hypothetical protein
VDRPRVLAVVAEPPEISANTTAVTLSALVAGAEPMGARWFLCTTLTSFVSTTQYGENTGDRGCQDDDKMLGDALSITAPALFAQSLFRDDSAVRAALGTAVPAAMLEQIRSQVGVAFSVESDVEAGGKSLRALKRVLISERESSHHNPPPPRFRFAERTIQGAAAFSCGPETPELVRVAPGEHVKLSPLLDDTDATEPWLETYNVLDARGVLSERKERAFYSWFSTHGKLDQATTEAPARDNTWDAPTQAACTTLWLVVRDGHGGESACSLPVTVGDADCPLASSNSTERDGTL